MDYIEVYSQAAEFHFHANLSSWITVFFWLSEKDSTLHCFS